MWIRADYLRDKVIHNYGLHNFLIQYIYCNICCIQYHFLRQTVDFYIFLVDLRQYHLFLAFLETYFKHHFKAALPLFLR